MLIQPDGLLSIEEACLREREDLLRTASSRKISGQAELEDAERSLGPRMSYSEVIRRLKKANSRIQIRDGSPGNVAIYAPKEVFEPDEPRGTFFDDHRYVSGMAKDFLPEFSHVILDSSNLPVREYRGWRSVVIACVKANALTYNQAVREFGEPLGARGNRWYEQLYAQRTKQI